MRRIVFIDNDCPQALDDRALSVHALGGTESSLLAVASRLARSEGLAVAVAQHNRTAGLTSQVSGVRFVRYDHRRGADLPEEPDAVVVLRGYKLLPRLRRQYPGARMFLWMHCYPGRRWTKAVPVLRDHEVTTVTVSDHLRARMIALLRPVFPRWKAERAVERIYNPVLVTGPEEWGPFEEDKLVFFSSPHKGLEEVLAKFRLLRREFPRLTLTVADPGYWRGPPPRPDAGIRVAGTLSPREIHREVARSLCVFYPQTTFEETFGLVFAEANALGTPVLAHPLGAAAEVLSRGGEGQVRDCTLPGPIIDTIRSWRDGGRPRVRAAPEFHPDAVAAQWQSLFARHLSGAGTAPASRRAA